MARRAVRGNEVDIGRGTRGRPAGKKRRANPGLDDETHFGVLRWVLAHGHGGEKVLNRGGTEARSGKITFLKIINHGLTRTRMVSRGSVEGIGGCWLELQAQAF
ncbi:MAG: hypothetical protein JWR19_372 [Pedosphaera sp.]|nr:hypothetical protein [Pedosphaera sp.]